MRQREEEGTGETELEMSILNFITVKSRQISFLLSTLQTTLENAGFWRGGVVDVDLWALMNSWHSYLKMLPCS